MKIINLEHHGQQYQLIPVAYYNKAGATPMGEKSHKFLADLAAHGPEGMKAFRRIHQPMVTQVNKKDRKSMADVIVTANKQRRPAGFAPQWSFAKDVICGDQFMVELGSGDLETRWEYLADGEMRTPPGSYESVHMKMLGCIRTGNGIGTPLYEFYKEVPAPAKIINRKAMGVRL